MINEQEFLRWIIASDKTKPYNYGQKRANGDKPNKGQKWLTPKEMAQLRLKELLEKELMCHCDTCLVWHNPEHDTIWKEVSR